MNLNYALFVLVLLSACADEDILLKRQDDEKVAENGVFDDKYRQAMVDNSQCSVGDSERITGIVKRKSLYPDRLMHFAQTWKYCSKSALGNTTQTFDCLKSNFAAIRSNCLICFASYSGCAKDNCWKKCWWNSNSPDCRQCSFDKCKGPLKTCSSFDVEREFPKI